MIGGIVSALVFLFLVLFLFKPKVALCTILCKVEPVGSPHYYSFKFVNTSSFSAHDIKAELYLVRKIPMSGGKYNNTYKQLSLVNGDISHIPARPLPWVNKPHNPHCIIIRSTEDLDNILKDDLNAVCIKISLKHGLTGLAKVFEHEYGNQEDKKRKV